MENKIDWMQFAQEPEEKPSIAQSALGGALQGATFGFADELAGAGRALMDPEAIRRQGLLEAYKKQRDISRQRFAEEERANPKSYLAGELGGSIATAPLAGAATLPRAMGLGAAYGLGKAQGSPLEQAGEAVTGAALGGVGEKVIGAASPYIKQGLEKGAAKLSEVGQGLKEKAEPWALAATGAMLKDWRKAGKYDQVNKIGRDLLDEGVVTPFASRAKIAERAGEKAEIFGKEIGDTLNELDNVVAEMKASAPADKRKAIYGNHFINRIKNEVLPGIYDNPAIVDEVAPAIEKKLEAIAEKYKDKYLSFNEAEELKRQFQNLIKYEQRNPSAKMEGLESLAKSMKGTVEDYAEEAAKKAGKPELLEKFQKAKSKYGSMAEAEKIAKDRLAREEANRFISPSDYGAGLSTGLAAAAKGASGGAVGAATMAGSAINQLFRRFGSQTSAVTLDAVGNMLKTAPEKLGKYGPVFEQALRQRGPQALNVLVNVGMKKDPELAQTIASELNVDVNAPDKENAIDWEEFVKQ